MESNLELTTMHTLSGQLVGTLPYMSPEQVSGDPDDVDTRSDVYSIGVMLFQLLVGRLPRDLTKRTLTEAARIIALEEPPLIGSIDRSLRGEVETIVARALAKDKTRRYQSVGDLGQDLHRYLAGEPIEAKRDSTLYVLKKSMRRHRYAVAAALAFVILVTASTIALAISYRRQGELLDDVRRQSDAEKLARSRAEAEAQKANAVNEFVRDMLASSDPSIAKGKDLLVRDMLDRAALRIDNGSLHDQLEIEAAVRHTMGVAYRSLSQYAPAESHLRKSLEIRKSLFGDSNNDYTKTAIALAGVLRDKGETTEALSLCEQAMAYYESSTGRNTERFSHALVLFADLVSVERSDFAGSVAAYREAIGILDTLLGPVNPQSAAALGNLGAQQLAYFRFEDAEKSLRLAHELAVDIYGPDHAVTIMNANNLAAMLTARGRKSEAETVARTALDSAIRLYGPRHVETGRIMFTVAVLARDRGDAIEAVRLCRGALAAVEKELAPDHSLVLWITLALADALATAHENQASADESLKLVMGVQQLIQEHNIENLFLAAETQSVFGNCLASVGRKNEAEVQLKSGYEKLKVCQGAGGNATMTALHRMIRFLDSEGRASDAAKFRSMLPREVAK
ncbi:MAG: tetratricopeptide repeat protein [Planctomycetes bacterium]|nr:tetratricopeptide repeat protein [Planctomycetota bacterium]